jgi:hypothetical protein
MYIITYYGFNPFMDTKIGYFTVPNILEGKCKKISNSIYGICLKEILISKNELENDYDKILEIFKNNTDEHF